MINSVVEMGRLVADPELKQTTSGVPVANFTLAVDRSYCKAGSERQADFIDFTAWKGTAEFVAKYFKKGQMMAVTGSIQTGMYTDKEGNKRKTFGVNAASVSFCGSKKDQGIETADNPYPAGDKPAPQYAGGKSGDFEEVPAEDDLPF